MALETVQYKARPLGNVRERKASISGIIHSIVLAVDCCLSSALGGVVVFWRAQVDIPTRTGMMMFVGSGLAKSIPRKLAFSGMMESATGFHEYIRWESPIMSLGLVPRLLSRAWYRPTQMGICINIGPRQPRGLTPSRRYRAIISRDLRCGSFLYRSWTSFILGCMA